MDISEVARQTGVPASTLRFYEEQGLLNPRREGTSRIFSNRDRVRLKLALRGKRLGFSLNEIRELFELYDLARDEGERHNLASRHPDVVAKADALMKSARTDDPNWPVR